MVNSKAKGANGERELKSLFLDELGFYLVRNPDQTRKGGYDCSVRFEDDLDSPIAIPFAIEFKRDEKLSTQAMWLQASNQTSNACYIPVVLYKRNYKPWKAILPDCILSKSDGPWCPDYDYTFECRLPLFFKIARELAKPKVS